MGWELFSQYARALHEAKPKYFIYENNKSMSKAIRASIDETFGFEAVLINSALVSAQNRQRLYWVGKRNDDGTYSQVPVEQPVDRGILLRDVLDTGVAWNEKAYNLTTRCCGAVPEDTLKRHRHTMVAEPVRGIENDTKSRTLTANYWKTNVRDAFVDCAGGRTMAAEPVCLRYERTEEAKRCRKAYEAHEIKHGYNELNELHPRPDGKTNTLTTVLKDNQIMEPVCVAERGRMYRGQPQHYEARTDGKTNTLTSVEKDNRVAEPVSYCTDKNIEHLMRDFGSKGKIVDGESKTPTLMAAAGMGGGNHIYYADSIAEPIKELSEKEMEYMVRDHQDRRWNFCNKPAEDDKSKCVTANTHKGVPYNVCAEPINDILQVGAMPMPNGELSTSAGFRIYSTEAKGRYVCANGGGAGAKTGLYAVPISAGNNKIILKAIDSLVDRKGFVPGMFNPYNRAEIAGKAPTLSTGSMVTSSCAVLIFETAEGKQIPAYEVHGGYITIKGKQYPIKLKDGFYIIRKLTVCECMRLQTVPEWYEFPVSDSQAYKMLGNGWTCEVIAHILKSLMYGGED